MNKKDHYKRHYTEDENVNIKCKFVNVTDEGYTAVGIRRENIDLIISEKKMRDNKTETGLWYEIDGVVISETDYNLELDVRDIEYIGGCVNDWIFDFNNQTDSIGKTVGSNTKYFSTNTQSAHTQSSNMTGDPTSDLGLTTSAPSIDNMTEEMSGFSTGGGKNIENFKQNIENNILPSKDSITHEGLLYQYEFDIGSRDKDKLFYPNYEQAVVKDPITNNEERYLTVGLDSGLDSFSRPPLDIMFVVDISGSMDHSIADYYYDGKKQPDSEKKTKMEATKDVLKNIVQELKPDDRFGVTLYNDNGIMAKPLRPVNDTDIEDIVGEIDEINSFGGTNLSEGFEMAVDEMKEFANIDTEDQNRESRVVFMTDAMPNAGETRKSKIEQKFKEAAKEGIYTTFIGIGIDTNPELIETISSIRGANHYFVQSVSEFNEKIRNEFDYTVTPLVFNLKLTVEAEGFTIDNVYGSPNDNSDTSGTVMDVKTLFPSHGKEGTKGGVIVLSMKDANIGDKVRISTSWTERDGTEDGDVTKVEIIDKEPNYYESNDTMKAILITKYVNLMSDFLEDMDNNENTDTYERKSQDIHIDESYREKMEKFQDFCYENESAADDISMEELETITKLLGIESG